MPINQWYITGCGLPFFTARLIPKNSSLISEFERSCMRQIAQCEQAFRKNIFRFTGSRFEWSTALMNMFTDPTATESVLSKRGKYSNLWSVHFNHSEVDSIAQENMSPIWPGLVFHPSIWWCAPCIADCSFLIFVRGRKLAHRYEMAANLCEVHSLKLCVIKIWWCYSGTQTGEEEPCCLLPISYALCKL